LGFVTRSLVQCGAELSALSHPMGNPSSALLQ
jgi:hypothetical protein